VITIQFIVMVIIALQGVFYTCTKLACASRAGARRITTAARTAVYGLACTYAFLRSIAIVCVKTAAPLVQTARFRLGRAAPGH